MIGINSVRLGQDVLIVLFFTYVMYYLCIAFGIIYYFLKSYSRFCSFHFCFVLGYTVLAGI
jgi:hypothetical protein